MADKQDGVWRTINGRKVFIKEGQSVTDAMQSSGKFKLKGSKKDAKTINRNKNESNDDTKEKIKQAYKDAWDKKGDYSKVEELKKKSGLSQRELAGIKNDADSEYKSQNNKTNNKKSREHELKDYLKQKKAEVESRVSKDNPYSAENRAKHRAKAEEIERKAYEAVGQKYDKAKLDKEKNDMPSPDPKKSSNRAYSNGRTESTYDSSRSYSAYQRDPYTGRKSTVVKNGVATKDHWYQDHAGNRHHISKGDTYDNNGTPTKLVRVPMSFAINYPNLSSAEIKKKYNEFLNKNRK